eukprot:m.112996 g.112996  ORF g.112996 m.112996 type:complete len:62 (-) comp28235_c0_seq1:1449-1634(-)
METGVGEMKSVSVQPDDHPFADVMFAVEKITRAVLPKCKYKTLRKISILLWCTGQELNQLK